MARLQLSKEVRAPAGTVFDYVDRHENYGEFFCGFSKFEWNAARHGAGTRLKMQSQGTVSLPTELETTAVVPEREIAGIFVSGLRGQWEWLFQPLGEATRVTVMVDYDLPLSELGQGVDRAILEQEFRSCIERTLTALKQRIESKRPTND